MAIAACIFVVAVSLTDDGDGDTDHFGLTSTKMSVTPGYEEYLPVWDLPSGKEYSDIQWSSDNPAVATVDGGRLSALSCGTAEITAKVKSGDSTFKDKCIVTVSDTVVPESLSYNVYTDSMDYARMTGSGFDNGLLALTFNQTGQTVITLAGYEYSWISINNNFVGSSSIDFTKIEMKIVDMSERIVAYSVYNNTYSGSPENGGTPGGTNTEAYSPTVAADLPYGSYDITFTLTYGMATEKVEGHFDYLEGDGLRDATGTYKRSYAWKCDSDNDGIIEECHFTMEYSYSDYCAGLLRMSHETYGKSTIRNYDEHSDVRNFVECTGSIVALAEKLADAYIATYPSASTDGQQFTDFILAFEQINFGYEKDSTQYYKDDRKFDENVDMWAHPAQTIFSGYGDCEDTSILLMSIYKSRGFDTACIILPSHMMASVSLDSFTDPALERECPAFGTEGDKNYYFCETTVNAPIKYKDSTAFTTRIGGWVSYANLPSTPGHVYVFNYYYTGMSSPSYEGTEFTMIVI